MKYLFLFWNLLKVLSHGQETDGITDCSKTIWGGPAGPNIDCVFPFKMNGRTFMECTTYSERNQRPWCATKLNENGEHLITSNDWSYCDRKCPFTDGSEVHHDPTTISPNDVFNKPSPRPKSKVRPTRPSTTPRTTTTAAPLNIDLVKNNETLQGTWLPKSEFFECGTEVSAGFITGGQDAKRGQYPFAALLGYEDLKARSPTGIVYLCGATLINRLYVVTAAHCHEPGLSGFEVIEVVLGEHDVAVDPDCASCVSRQTFSPKKILLHERWTSSNTGSVPDFDIALIRLDRWATFVEDDFVTLVMPVCLEPPIASTLDTKVIVIGWGQTGTKRDGVIEDPAEDHLERYGVGHRTLQKLKVPLVKNSECNNFFPGITDNHICAGGVPGQDSCNGDSGGGLVTEDQPMFFVGIVSSGSRICGVGEPGIYTKIESMYPWIKANLEP